MQNYNPPQLAPNHPIPMTHGQASNQLPPTEIREKLKRLLSQSSEEQPQMMTGTGSETSVVKQGKVTKRSKKDANDSESNCGGGTTKDEEKSKTGEKHVHKPDILTTILNEKKASLVRDPEVIAFLKKFNQELQRGRLQK